MLGHSLQVSHTANTAFLCKNSTMHRTHPAAQGDDATEKVHASPTWWPTYHSVPMEGEDEGWRGVQGQLELSNEIQTGKGME